MCLYLDVEPQVNIPFHIRVMRLIDEYVFQVAFSETSVDINQFVDVLLCDRVRDIPFDLDLPNSPVEGSRGFAYDPDEVSVLISLTNPVLDSAADVSSDFIVAVRTGGLMALPYSCPSILISAA